MYTFVYVLTDVFKVTNGIVYGGVVAYVYNSSISGWSLSYLYNNYQSGNGISLTGFGFSVALSGNYLVVGAPYYRFFGMTLL